MSIFSQDEDFELQFFDPFRKKTDGEAVTYQTIMTPDGYCVIGEKDQHFQMRVKCKDQGTYGLKVIVDGFQINKKKTFRQQGVISGFPQEDGSFKVFKFARPLSDQESGHKFEKSFYRPPWDETQNDVRDYHGGPGQIIVKICETERMQSKGQGGGGPRKEPDVQILPKGFQQFGLNQKKDMFLQCLGVAEGEVELPKTQSSNRSNFGGEGRRSEFYNKILYESIVQSYRVLYTDCSTLVSRNLLRLNKHNDFIYLTHEFLYKNDQAIIQILQTLIQCGQLTKDIKDISVKVENLVEKLKTYLTNCDFYTIFLNEEELMSITLDRDQRMQQNIIKLLLTYPQFFRQISDDEFGIESMYDVNLFISQNTQKQKEKTIIYIEDDCVEPEQMITDTRIQIDLTEDKDEQNKDEQNKDDVLSDIEIQIEEDQPREQISIKVDY